MKKVLAIVALFAAMFVAGNVQAQSTVYAGYAPESFVTGNSSSNYQGFFAGFTQNFGLAKGIGAAVGGQFRMNMKSETSTLLNVKETQIVIDVPILFNYKIGVNRDLAIIPFVGPMLSLALTGNTKTTENVLGNAVTVNWYGDNSIFNRFNLYAVFGADVKFNQFNLFGGYRLGLLDINKSNNIATKTNGFFIGLGFNL